MMEAFVSIDFEKMNRELHNNEEIAIVETS
jgi:hypothetical protein